MTDQGATHPSPLLTIQQAAEILGWSVPNTRRKISSGELASIKLGGRTIRIARADLDAFIASKRRAQRRRRTAS